MRTTGYRNSTRAPSPIAMRRVLKRLELRLESYAYHRYLDGPRRWECPGCDLTYLPHAFPNPLPPMEIFVGRNVVVGMCERCVVLDIDLALDAVSRKLGEPLEPERAAALAAAGGGS